MKKISFYEWCLEQLKDTKVEVDISTHVAEALIAMGYGVYTNKPGGHNSIPGLEDESRLDRVLKGLLDKLKRFGFDDWTEAPVIMIFEPEPSDSWGIYPLTGWKSGYFADPEVVDGSCVFRPIVFTHRNGYTDSGRGFHESLQRRLVAILNLQNLVCELPYQVVVDEHQGNLFVHQLSDNVIYSVQRLPSSPLKVDLLKVLRRHGVIT